MKIIVLAVVLVSGIGFLHETKAQDSLLRTADSLYATGNYTKAINYYSRVADESSKLQIARAYNAIGNYEKAILQYEDLVAKNPTLQIAGFELGKLLIKAKEYKRARKLFASLAEIENGNPEYLYYLGESFRKLDEQTSSLVAYKKAVEIDSTHLRSLFKLGKYYTAQQETNQALQFIDRGLRFYENEISFINLKALNLFNDGQFNKAVLWFERLIEMGEIQTYIYQKLAYSHYKNWEFEKAKNAYRKWIELDDANSDAYFGMAEALRKNRQLDSAEIYIKKSMDVQRPIFAEGYSRLAGLARDRNDLKSALKYYRLAHNEEPTDAMLYFNVCTIADQYYKDPKTKLGYYENFKEKFGKNMPYASKAAAKRIKELKEEIHFAADD